MSTHLHDRNTPRLLDQVRELMRVQHYSIRTEQTYLQWIRRFILFHDKRHPRELGADEVTAFLSHLAVNRNVAGLHAEPGVECRAASVWWRAEVHVAVAAKKPKRLPVVLTRDEVKTLRSVYAPCTRAIFARAICSNQVTTSARSRNF